MKTLTVCVVTLVSFLSVSFRSAQAEVFSVPDLLKMCSGKTDQPMRDKAYCAGFIEGVMGGHSFMVSAGAKPMYCLPNNEITSDKAINIITQWTIGNPKFIRGEKATARGVVLIALFSVFPC